EDLKARLWLLLIVQPGPGFEATVDVHPAALTQILRKALCPLPNDPHPHPFGAVLPLALGRPRPIVRCHPEREHRPSFGRIPHLRILAKIPHERRLEHRSASSAPYSSSSRTSKCRITDSFNRRVRSSGSVASGVSFSFATV